MIRYDVAKEFSRNPGGRFAKDGPHSGEAFLYGKLVPLWEQFEKTQEQIQLDFSGCRGATVGFLDESIGELASLFGEEEVLRRFAFFGEYIVEDIPGVIKRGAKEGHIATPELNKAKATATQRRHVQSFMDWCEAQEPNLILVRTREEGVGFDAVVWQHYCTKWCEINEKKMEAEKMKLLELLRKQTALFEKAKKWTKR